MGIKIGKKLSLLMLMIVLGQIAYPLVANASFYYAKNNDQTKSEISKEIETEQSEEVRTDSRGFEVKNDFGIDDFGVNGEISKSTFEGEEVLSLSGAGTGGLGLINYKISLASDFNVKLHIDVEGKQNDNGFSFLISPVSNIGYYAKGQNTTAGVRGNKNSLYISRKYGNSEWSPGVHYGVTNSAGEPNGDNYIPSPQNQPAVDYGDIDLAITYNSAAKQITFALEEAASTYTTAKTYSGSMSTSALGEDCIISIITGFKDDIDHNYYLSIEEMTASVESFFDYTFTDQDGGKLELGDTLEFSPKFTNNSNTYNVSYTSNGYPFTEDGGVLTQNPGIINPVTISDTDTITPGGSLASANKDIVIKSEADVVGTTDTFGDNLGVYSDVTTTYTPINTTLENPVKSSFLVEQREDVISADKTELSYVKTAPPTSLNQIVNDANITVDDGYFLDSTTDAKITDLTGDGTELSPRLTSDLSSYDLTVPGTYTINVNYQSVDGDGDLLPITINILDPTATTTFTKVVTDSTSAKKTPVIWEKVEEFVHKDTKTGDSKASPSEELTYIYTIQNPLNYPISSVTLMDPLNDVDLSTDAPTLVNITGSSLGDITSSVTGDLKTGLVLGEIPAKETITIEYKVKAGDAFIDLSNLTIDTTATIDSTDFAFPIVEDDSATLTPDIEKDLNINIVNPDDSGIIVDKTVTSSTIDSPEDLASPYEKLHYKYTITNNELTRTDVALQDVILTDPLDDSDLVVRGNEPLTITGGTSTGSYTTTDIRNGINLGQLNPNKNITVEFDAEASAKFTNDPSVIDTKSYITAANYDDRATVIYENDDDNIDIKENLSVDPGSEIEFTKGVIDADWTMSVEAGQNLSYMYTISNNSDVPLKGVKLQDPLDDIDLGLTGKEVVTVTGGTNAGTYNTEDLIEGIDLGTIAQGDANDVTVIFTTSAAATFTNTDGINSSAVVTTDNTGTREILEVYNKEASTYQDKNPDILQDLKIDPTNPEVGLELKKTVEDTTASRGLINNLLGSGDGLAAPSETLNYTYEVFNNSPVPAENVALKDPLDDSDLNLTTATTITGATGTMADLQGAGINLGTIPANSSVKVSFSVDTNSTFTKTSGINSSAIVTSNNTGDGEILESYDESSSTYADVDPDIKQNISVDASDEIEFIKTVTDSSVGTIGQANPAETLNYSYIITNNSSVPLDTVVLQDPLDDSDLDITTATAITGATGSIADLQGAGINLGTIEPTASVTVSFSIDTNSTFVGTDGINSKAKVTTDNTQTIEILESYSKILGYKDVNPDIVQDNTVDPTDPETGIKFTKEVIDANTLGAAERVSPGEALNYTYTIENLLPSSRAAVPLTGVKLTDKLDDVDLAVVGDEVVTITNGTDTTTSTTSEVISGLDLGEIAAGGKVKVTFTVPTDSTFVETNGINSSAVVTTDNTQTREILESYNAVDGYKDINPDIEQDNTVDPTDPETGIKFTKDVVDANTIGTSGTVSPSEALNYTYKIENLLPSSRAAIPLTGVKLMDDLEDPDLAVAGDEVVTVTNGTEEGTYTTTEVINGLNLGEIAPGETVTVTFTVPTASTFVETNGINSSAVLTTDNTEGKEILEAYSKADGYKDVDPDINQDNTVDPTDPETGIKFTKDVMDANTLGTSGTVSPGEELNYTYTIESLLPSSRAAVPLTGVKLTDKLDDLDLAVVGDEVVTITNGTDTTTSTTSEVIGGLDLGEIAAGGKVTVTFTVPTASTFVETDGINSSAVLTTDNTEGREILESYSEVDGYKDVNPDIEQDNTVDPTDPETGIKFTKAVIDANALGTSGTVSPGEELNYTYTIENLLPSSKAAVPLTGVKLTDKLDDADLAVVGDEVVTITNGTDTTTATTSEIIGGLDLGEIVAGGKVTVTFTIPTASTFTETDGINSSAVLTTDNTDDKEILEAYDKVDGYKDIDPDIEQDITVDPTDPETGIKFEKTVEDTTASRGLFNKLLRSGDGAASPSETLNYTYKVTNNATVPLNNVILQDSLNDVDLDITTATAITGTTGSIADLQGAGINLGTIAPTTSVTVTFSVDTKSTFIETNGINSSAVLTTDNIGDREILESYSEVDGYKDVNPDIVQDNTVDPTDPLTGIKFTKDVIDANTLGTSGTVSPGEELNYTYTIENLLPSSRTSVPLTGVKLTDKLDDLDLAVVGDEVVTITNGTDTTTSTTSEVIGGLDLGEIAPGGKVTVTFTVPTASSFVETNGINSSAVLTTDNTEGREILESYSEADGYKDVNPDINQDNTVDPTDPLTGIKFTKDVMDANTLGTSGTVSPGEALNYTYTIESLLPSSRAAVPLTGVKLTDVLGDPDLAVVGDEVVTITNGTDTTTSTTSEVIGGLDLGEIAPGGKVTVTFTVPTASTFTETDGINSSAVLTTDNTEGKEILEAYDKADGYKDIDPDIEQDITVDPTDPETGIKFEKTVEDTTASRGLFNKLLRSGDGAASPSETLNYTYKVTNNAAVPLDNVILQDSLNEVDLDITTATAITGATGSIADLQGTGINIGTIEPTASVTVSFSIDTNSTFIETNGINSSAVLTTDNTEGREILESYNETDGYKDVNPDIVQDNTVDPTDPLTGIKFTKDVIDANTLGTSGTVSPGEALNYTYTIENLLPSSRTSVPLTGVKLTDKLDDLDLAVVGDEVVTITNGTDTTTATTSEVIGGLDLGEIAAGGKVTVTFTVPTASSFTETDGINSSAVLTTDNTEGREILESYNETDGYKDIDPDIEQDNTVDPTDPLTGIKFTKAVIDANTLGTSGTVSPGEELNYTYTIESLLPSSRAAVPLTGVKLTDKLDDADLAVVGDEVVTITNGTDTTTATTSEIIGGLDLGEIAAGGKVTVTFTIPTASTFGETNGINSSAVLTTDNTEGREILESYNETDGYKDIDPDIEQDNTVDPTNPETGIKFTKDVIDANTLGTSGTVSPGEELNYTYTIESLLPSSRAAVPLTGVKLTDKLDDLDLAVVGDEVVTITNGTDTTTATTSEVIGGLDLGEIAPGSKVTVTFTVPTASSFVETDGINSSAVLTTDNIGDREILESYSEADGYKDIDPDIYQDTSIDPTDPETGIKFTKAVMDANTLGTSGTVSPGEELNYTYTIENLLPASRAAVPLTGVKLTDVLGDPDLAVVGDEVVTITNGTDTTTSTTSEVIGGLDLGEIAAGDIVTVTFTVPTASTFTETDGINSSAVLTTDNTEGREILEAYDKVDGYKDIDPDIEQDITVDPTDPETGIKFEKTVEDTTASRGLFNKLLRSGDGAASPSETLNYTYKVTNNAAVPLDNVILQDSLNDVDLDITTATAITGTTGSIADLQGAGINLGTIAPTTSITVTFSVDTKSTFIETNGINSSAVLTTDNTQTIEILEAYSKVDGYKDIDPDIEQDITVDPTDPIKGIKFTKVVMDANTLGTSGTVSPGEELNYTYTIENLLPASRTSVPLTGVKLTDVLGDPDLAVVGDEVVTITNGTDTTTATTSEVIGGLDLGEIAPGGKVTVTFTVPTASSFVETNGINSSAVLTTDNTEGREILESYNEVDGYKDVNPDINQDTSIDPTDPETGIKFTKAVMDANTLGTSGTVSPGEALNYTYTIESLLPSSRATIPLTGVKVTDKLDDADLAVVGDEVVTITNGTDTTTSTTSEVINGLDLGEIAPGGKVTVTFTIPTASTFVETNGINSSAVLTTDNTEGREILESYNETDGYQDVNPDINQDNTVDPTDPLKGIKFTKVVMDANTLGTSGTASPGEALNYTYTIENLLPASRAAVPLTGVKLTDVLGDPDLAVVGDEVVTITNGTDTTTATTTEVIGGLDLGEIAPGGKVTVTFTVPTVSSFTETDGINSSAVLTTDNTGTREILETYNDTDAVYEDAIDIEQDLTIDPTSGVSFTKVVTDGGVGTTGTVSPGENLTYTYTIENINPTRAAMPLTGVTLTDPLNDRDSGITGSETVTVIGGTNAGTYSTADIKGGLDLGEIAVGQQVEVTFTTTASSTFNAVNGINSIAEVTLNGFDDKILEQYDGTDYVDVNPDIAQDVTIDPTDPTSSIEFIKTVSEPNNNLAGVGETLSYEYEITNVGNVPLQGVRLKDVLTSEIDLAYTGTEVVTVVGGAKEGSYTTANVVAGLNLGLIKPGESVTVTFNMTTTPTMNKADGINSIATVSLANLDIPVKETYNTDTNTYEDVKPDIAQDLAVDSSDVEFVKTVTDADGTAEVAPGELLTYTYEITNNSVVYIKPIKLKDDLKLENDLDLAGLSNLITITSTDPEYVIPAAAEGATVQNIVDGLALGIIRPGTTLTVTFNMNASTVFADSDPINSKAFLSSSNFSVSPIKESQNASGTYIDVIDIDKDLTLDPTDPDNGVEFIKTVSDTNDGQAQAAETLHYSYAITNLIPTRAGFPLTNVVLEEDLASEQDLDFGSITNVNIVANNGYVTGSNNITFNEIAPGETVTVDFDMNTKSSFTQIDGINTIATVQLDPATGVTDSLQETATGDQNPDIAQDLTGQDLIVSHSKCYVGTAPTIADCDALTSVSDYVKEGESIGYKLVIDNSEGSFRHSLSSDRGTQPGDFQGDYEVTNSNFKVESALNGSSSVLPTEIAAGDTLTIYYTDLIGTFSDSLPVINQLSLEDTNGLNTKTYTFEEETKKESSATTIRLYGESFKVLSTTKAATFKSEALSSGNPALYVAEQFNMYGIDSNGDRFEMSETQNLTISPVVNNTLIGWNEVNMPVYFPAEGSYPVYFECSYDGQNYGYLAFISVFTRPSRSLSSSIQDQQVIITKDGKEYIVTIEDEIVSVEEKTQYTKIPRNIEVYTSEEVGTNMSNQTFDIINQAKREIDIVKEEVQMWIK